VRVGRRATRDAVYPGDEHTFVARVAVLTMANNRFSDTLVGFGSKPRISRWVTLYGLVARSCLPPGFAARYSQAQAT
jgi:hypothetical protein